MKRIVLAVLALALLAPLALSRSGDDADAQTATGPMFESITALYRLDAGSDGSTTAIVIGTLAFTAGTVTGGTDACAKGAEFLNPNASLSPFITSGGTASTVFSVSSACEITYTGAAAASAVSATRAGWSLTVNLSDGVDASGNTDTTVDSSALVTIKLLNAATDLAAVKALYDNAGGSSWTTDTNWDFMATLAANWHGVTLTGGRLSALALPNNNLVGSIPAGLGELTALTSLDLSDNSGLTGSIPGALTRIPGLTNLDLSDTGVCVDPANEPDIETWLNAIRARSGGVALVDTCGSPAAPSIAAAAVTYGLESGADGSSTAIGIGRFSFTASTYSGATHTCVIGTAIDNPSSDPADFLTTGTPRTNFSVSTLANACILNYGGSGITAASGTLEAVSIRVGVSDGVDATGADDTAADDTIDVTVKLRGINTDGAALHAIYTNAGGSGWTTTTGWLSAGALATLTASSTWHGVTITGGRVAGLDLSNNNLTGAAATALAELPELDQLTSLDLSSPAAADLPMGTARTPNAFTGAIPAAIGTLQRLTSLDLSGAGFSGAIPAAIGDLTALTSLDLGGNALTGNVPTELFDLTSLTSLDLGGNGLAGTIPTDVGDLTALTTLDLGGNALTGAIPTELGDLTSLTSLDLSGNAGLTADVTVLGTLASNLTSLTNLDLSGTGICIDVLSGAYNPITRWIQRIRETGTDTGVAKVPTCGSPVAPALNAAAVTYGLTSGADGSTTAIAIGAPAFTEPRPWFAGAAQTDCAITSARTNPSNDPADFITTGGTDLSSDFAVTLSGSTCAITYTGSGITSAIGTLEAVSLAVAVNDNVDPEAGTHSTAADDTIQVTVKLRGIATDRDALQALYDNGGGASWTASTGWAFIDGATIASFSGTAGTTGSWTGYHHSSTVTGTITPATFTLEGTTYTVRRLIWIGGTGLNANRVQFSVVPQSGGANFADLRIRVGATATTNLLTTPIDTNLGSVSGGTGYHFRLTGISANPFTSGSAYTAALFRPSSVPSASWHGVTLTSGRVSGLDLSNNNVRGAVATVLAGLGDLDQLTSLDLSSPAAADLPQGTTRTPNAFTGAIPASIGALTQLTSLDLSGAGFSGAIPAEMGDLTALTTLDLSGNSLNGAIPQQLEALTALTTLDLSGNAGLTATATVLGALATNLTSLTMLDLSGTGVCVDPGDAMQSDIVDWITDIRETGTNTGVAKVATCGAPAAPAFSAASARASLEAGADGSSTAIAIGAPTFTEGAYAGGDTAACAIATAKENASYDPADFTTTGTDVTGFAVAVSGTTCVITYEGSGLASSATRVAVSIAVTVSDGVDPAAGTISDDADDTINVTVKLVGRATDRIALGDLYRSAGGSGWTAAAGWPGRPRHTFGLTAGSGTVTATLGTGNGYQATGTGAGAIGSVRSGGTFVLNDIPQPGGNTLTVNYELRRLVQLANGNVLLVSNQASQPVSRFDSLSLRIGTATLAFSSATSTVSGATRHWTWTGQPAGLIPATGDFDVLVVDADPGIVTGSWHGVTVSGGRVTQLDLTRNNLSGTLPDSFADLSALTSLTLSHNPGLRGPIPGVLGSLASLTTLILVNSGWSGTIPVELGSLTSLTWLELSNNDLSGDIPSELGSLTGLTILGLAGNRDLGGDLSHLTSLTSLNLLTLTFTRFCVNPITDTAVESWLNALRARSSLSLLAVRTCGAPVAPRLADEAATYLLDVGADGSSTPVAVGEPTFTSGTYSGGMDSCTYFNAWTNPSADPANFLTSGTAVTGFTVDETNCALTWTGSSAPTRTAGTREAFSIRLNVRDGVNNAGGVSSDVDDSMQVTVKLVDLATDRIGLEALHDGTNGDNWTTRTGWGSATLSSSWHGVTVASNRVTALSLPNNRLRGRLPALLGDLTALTTLNLSDNDDLSGGIPQEFARLRSLVTLDLRNTRVCARNVGGAAVNAWLNAIRAKPGGSVRLGSCPSAAPIGGSAGITLREEGPDAPSGLRYSLLLTCGGTSLRISLGAGERYAASVSGASVCSLALTDRLGATGVRGEFSGRTLAGDVTITIVRGVEDGEDGPPAAEGPNPELERSLVMGISFARWRAPETPVADAVEELTLCVTAVYWWNARTQSWRSWFPGADGLGVNTLATLREDAIYVFAAQERTPVACGLLPAEEEDGDGEDEEDEDGSG